MSIRLKPHSQRATNAFLRRSAVLLGLFVLVSNVGFALAQGLRDPTLLRTSLNVSEFPRQVDLFISLRESWLIPGFAIAMLVFIVLALGHFFAIGPKDMSARDERDLIPWWNLFERIVHLVMLVTFVILAISGLAVTFGRYLGGGTPGLLLRHTHEYSGFVFTVFLVILFLMWVRHAIPRSYDLAWFSKMGGYLGYKGALKSDKFNAGQKVWYWIVVLAGILLAYSGLMEFFGVGTVLQRRTDVMIHFFAAIPIILMFLVHLYLTTIGTKGAFMGMVNGRISKTAAQQLHSEAPELRRAQPAGSDD
ncbi:MAG TPA: formate dehydrogenase subunit gamma [bacterium]|nr:formate dehydrogenase subunit gamma [bacterium]